MTPYRILQPIAPGAGVAVVDDAEDQDDKDKAGEAHAGSQ